MEAFDMCGLPRSQQAYHTRQVPDAQNRINELIDRFGECKGRYFTCLDLMKGYHQVKVAEESKPRIVFSCHMGLFQYQRMPFSLTNASATFQHLMS